MRKTCAERGKITLPIDVKIKKRFEGKANELVDVEAPNLCGHLMDRALKACDDLRGKEGEKKRRCMEVD